MIAQCGDGSAAIDLVSFEAQFPDTDGVRDHTVTLLFAARTVQEATAESTTIWSALQNPGVYSAPGQENVYSAMVPVTNAANALLEDVETAAAALRRYADEAAEIKTRYLTTVKPEAQAFMAETAGDPEWNTDRAMTDKQDRILASLTALTMELEETQRRCANALGGMWGGATYGAADETGRAGAGERAFGLTGGAYEAMGEANLLSWGNNAEWNYTGFKQGSIPQGMMFGFMDGARDTVEFAGSLLFIRGAEKGQEAWAGLGDLVVTMGFATHFGALGDTARAKLWDMGGQAIGLDMWETDPARAGGRNIFDIATILIPGGLAAKALKVGDLGSIRPHAPGHTPHRPAPSVQSQARQPAGIFAGLQPSFAGIPDTWLADSKTSVWRNEAVDPDSRGSSGSTGSSSGTPAGDGPPQYGVRMPNLNDPRPGYVGRAPDMQPQVGEAGIGGGSWNYTAAQTHGGPYQQFITGVEPVDGKWLEYMAPVDKGTPGSNGQVKFDGYIPDPGPPPLHRFQEAKANYAWMMGIKDRFNEQLGAWFQDQFRVQALAIKDIPNARLEWSFAEESVRDAFLRTALQDPVASEMLAAGRLQINWVPMPKNG
ncbi:hypothetical protein ACFVRT_15980 [Arthrobacter koreensis]|uniref:hypothetical protein n=1 Tax=Arthrobacter koreensis TaxID=199136 RepID=UPI0036DB6D23